MSYDIDSSQLSLALYFGTALWHQICTNTFDSKSRLSAGFFVFLGGRMLDFAGQLSVPRRAVLAL